LLLFVPIGYSILTTLDKDLAKKFLPSMSPIHPVVLEKKIVLHISHRVAMLNYVPDQLLLLFVPIGYSIWLPGVTIASDWLKFQRFSSPILHGG
jgi:putative effector of murein hydrolase LrgA (UPF0299 family)